MDNVTSLEQTPQITEAQGMVSAQVDCTGDEALFLLNERATACGLRLEEVALAVVQHRTRFRHAIGH